MTFYRYMMRKHIDDNSPKGQLARVIKSDKEHFPMNGRGKFNGWHKLILDHLNNRSIYSEHIEAFETCREEYVICEKRK